MKIFKVTVDNNYGGWKSGEDPSTLVLATNEEDAIEKVKNGWWSSLEWYNDENDKRHYQTIYSPQGSLSYINENSRLSATEIIFKMDGYTVEVFNPRKKKLENIYENIRNNR